MRLLLNKVLFSDPSISQRCSDLVQKCLGFNSGLVTTQLTISPRDQCLPQETTRGCFLAAHSYTEFRRVFHRDAQRKTLGFADKVRPSAILCVQIVTAWTFDTRNSLQMRQDFGRRWTLINADPSCFHLRKSAWICVPFTCRFEAKLRWMLTANGTDWWWISARY